MLTVVENSAVAAFRRRPRVAVVAVDLEMGVVVAGSLVAYLVVGAYLGWVEGVGDRLDSCC